MKNSLFTYGIAEYITQRGFRYNNLEVSYELTGRELHNAPVVVIIHALTGNSNVAGEKAGWWREMIGCGCTIDTNNYSVISFNIPGNGVNGNFIDSYDDFTANDIGRIFLITLDALGIDDIYAIIGGSIGGGITWEMALLKPDGIQHVIPIAAHWRSTDWIIGHNYIQKRILKNSSEPLQDARIMAMLFYRTPISLTNKFKESKSDTGELYNVESWLLHHGEKLNSRFNIKAYRFMTHLMSTLGINCSEDQFRKNMSKSKAKIIQIAIDSDILFVAEDNKRTKIILDELGISNDYFEIKSDHGHDAFLIEFEQLSEILVPVFKIIKEESNENIEVRREICLQ